ncbi:hypothetical protein [Streptacidiphilus sp. PAMC 29251]
MKDIEPPTGNAAGYCHRCGKWSAEARIIAEIHCDAGAGGTVVRCQPCDLRPTRRTPSATDPRRYPA